MATLAEPSAKAEPLAEALDSLATTLAGAQMYGSIDAPRSRARMTMGT